MTLDLFGGRRLVLAGYRLGGVWIAAGLVAIVVLWFLYRTERHLVSRRAGLFLLALRLAATVALVLALFEPIAARVFDESVRGRVIVAVDVSQSMETADPGRPADARRELAQALELSPGEPVEKISRREVARRLIDRKNAPIARLTDDHAVDAFAFARTTAPATLDALAESLKNPTKADDPSRRMTDWQPALAEALRSGESGAPVLGVVLVTDGRQNAPGDPMPIIDRLASRGMPVFPILVGSTVPPRDAAIATVKAPETVYRGDVARIEATLKIDGYPGQEVIVTLDRPGGSPMRQTVRAPADGRIDRPAVTFSVPLEQVGTAALSIAIGPLEGDIRPDNDRRNVMIQVVDDKANVLLVDGEARWEFRYLRNALARDPHAKTTAVVFHQPGSAGATKPSYETAFPALRDPSEKQPDPLGTFDLVIVGDVDPADLTTETWTRLESYVAERGGTLVLNPGPKSWAALLSQETTRKLLPVQDPHLAPVDSSAIDPAHPAMPPGVAMLPAAAGLETAAWPMLQLDSDPARNRSIWAGLPRMPWVLSGRPKPGATLLATAGGDDASAAIAAQPYGLGKVLWIGTDGTWRWRHRVGDAYHHRFWGQVVRWATSSKLASGNAFVRFGPIRPRIEEGGDVRIQARIGDGVPGLGPDLLIAARLFKVDPATRATTADEVAIVSLSAVAGQPRTFEGTAPSLPAGAYAVRLDVPQLAEVLHLDPAHGPVPEARLDVIARQTSEDVELAAARDPLDRLAGATGGRVLADYEAGQIAPLLRARTKSLSRTEETPLWDQPLALFVFFGILTVEWVARKRLGLP
ncbi:MAG: hypothetical protein ACLQGP_14870 [Isosphaeraceae bacterium]